MVLLVIIVFLGDLGYNGGMRLTSLEGKLDQLTGVLNGFLMGQQSGGGSKSSGGGGGSSGGGDGQNQEVLGILQQIAGTMGIQSTPPAGADAGAAAMGPLGAGMPGQPSPAVGPLTAPPPTDGGMTVMAREHTGNGEKTAPAAMIGDLLKNFNR